MNAAEITTFHGINPSTICPLKEDYSIDETAVAQHVDEVTSVPGIVGVLCKGHAGETGLLDRGERKRVVEVTREAVSRRGRVIAGVNYEESGEAAEHSRDAAAAGVGAVMVFAPFVQALSQDETMAVDHHQAIRQAVDLPLMLFQGSVRSGRIAQCGSNGVRRRTSLHQLRAP